jgi:hypothetical protein
MPASNLLWIILFPLWKHWIQSLAQTGQIIHFFHRFTTYFDLNLGISVFDRAEKPSKLLQPHHLTAAAVKTTSTDMIISLQSSLNDKQVDEFWTQTTNEAVSLHVTEPMQPRRTGASVCIYRGSEGAIYECLMKFDNAIHCEFHDFTMWRIGSRYDPKTFDVYMNAQ